LNLKVCFCDFLQLFELFCNMQFLYPSFLFALGLIAIPILIHLFNFRRYKKVVFSDIRFLKQLTEQTKKQQKIKEWLILLCRVLLISFLVLAFAQPYIPSQENKAPLSKTGISIYLDNSFSMNALASEGALLDQAKIKAEALVNAFPNQQVFQFLNNDFEGKYMRQLNKSEVLTAIQATQPSAAHRSLTAIFNRQKALIEQVGMEQGELYWISDFQKNMEPSPVVQSENLKVHLLPLAASQNQNVWIDTAFFVSPLLKIGSQNKLQVVIKNESDNDFENQPLVLKIDGVQKAIQNVSCKAKQKVNTTVFFTLTDYNWHALSLSITDYPIVFDDVYYLAAKAQQSLPVMVLNDNYTNPAFERVFDLDSFYSFTNMALQQIDFAKLNQQALLILNEPTYLSTGLTDELHKYIQNGGVVLFIPPAKPTDAASLQQFLNKAGVGMQTYVSGNIQVGEIEPKDPLFAQVFSSIPNFSNLPSISGYWQLSPLSAQYRTILSLKNQEAFLVRTKWQKGSLYAFSAPLQPEINTLVKHPLFVPIMLNLPLQRNRPLQGSFLLGEKTSFQIPLVQSEKLLSLEKDKESHLIEVQSKDGSLFGSLNGQIQEAGVFDVKSGEVGLAKLAFNYSRAESSQGFLNPDDLLASIPASKVADDLAVFSEQLRLAETGSQYWKWALALALLFLLAEFALLAWWK